MEFQNQPFQDLKARVADLEEMVRALATYLKDKEIQAAKAKPTTVLETQDDERGKPFFKTMEEVQET